jgi:hypothetical protein
LILAQAAHSVEEYFGRLWETFPPATFIAGLVSQDRQFGFLLVNAVLVAFGVWCYLLPVRRGWRSAVGIATGWAIVELINGIGHTFWSLRQRAYTPGLATAPVLLVLSLAMLGQIREMNSRRTSA